MSSKGAGASGIIVGATKNIIITKFKIIHEITESEKLEAVLVETWKKRRHFSTIFLYNPPENTPDLDILENILQANCMIVGNFNSPSTRCGYQRTTQVGKTELC
jgi:hypothetical protein